MNSKQNPLISILTNNPNIPVSAYVKDGDYMCPRCHHISKTETCSRCGCKCNRYLG